jgi:hypothetical protein
LALEERIDKLGRFEFCVGVEERANAWRKVVVIKPKRCKRMR